MPHNTMICTIELRVTNSETSVYYSKHLLALLRKQKDFKSYKKRLLILKKKFKTITRELEVLTLRYKCD